MRTTTSLFIKNVRDFKQKILGWSEQFEQVVYLDSNDYRQNYSSYDMVLAVDAFTLIQTDYLDGFQKLNEYYRTTKDWIFGYLSYDLKNATECLKSNNFDGLHFSDLFFFQPKKLFILRKNELEIQYLRIVDDQMDLDLTEIENYNFKKENYTSENIVIKSRINKEDYFKKVETFLEHIRKGDIYEANFCMEFYAENVKINPLETYKKLNKISESPFSAYLKNKNHYVLCASPERYIGNKNGKIISQPIKGTSKRFKNTELDKQSKTDLEQSPKERSENIMVVDLIRNDLSKTAEKLSVKVEELCKAHSFKQAHHLISTISSKKKSEIAIIDVLEKSFPMGSMTGVPKISAMQIIEKQEETKRGVYSGSIGYFAPNGDFDCNVVIRSIFYNNENKFLSFSVGSAITAKSSSEQEYQECLLKTETIIEALTNQTTG